MIDAIGTRFEKYVQMLLNMNGTETERNLLYHRGKRRSCQVDLESVSGLIFKTKTIYECKYVGPGNSPDFTRFYIQLGEALLFTGADRGVLVTNAQVHQRDLKENRYRIKVYDQLHLLALRHDDKPLERQVSDMEREIRQMTYDKDADNAFLHRYL